MNTMTEVIEKRWREYTAEYADHEPELVREAIYWFWEPLSFVFGYRGAERAIRSAFEGANVSIPSEDEAGTGFYGLIDVLPPSELNKFKIARDLASLNAFAFYGLPIAFNAIGESQHIPESREDREGCISALIETFRLQLPVSLLKETEVWMALRAAEARLAIDTGDNETVVSQEGLAALAGVSVKTIKNVVAPSSGSGIRALEDGSISVIDARRWLLTRSDYRPSVWQFGEPDQCGAKFGDHTQELLSSVLFVPVTKDGTWFSPEHKRSARYWIGSGDNQETFDSYLDALERLITLETPKWRRPGEKGRSRIATGVTWARKTMAELGL